MMLLLTAFIISGCAPLFCFVAMSFASVEPSWELLQWWVALQLLLQHSKGSPDTCMVSRVININQIS